MAGQDPFKLDFPITECIEGVYEGLMTSAELILERAQELVPVDTWELHNSAYIEEGGSVSRGDKVIEVGFSARHAVPVHERLDVYHSNGQAKFLETATIEFEDMIPEFAAQGFIQALDDNRPLVWPVPELTI